MTKRILSILVAALMVMALFPMSVFAKAASPGDRGEAPKAVLDEPVYSCSFEAGDGYEFWSLFDADGDGSSWELVSSYTYDGSSALVSYSYKNGSALDPDNWVITPAIHVPENDPSASFYAANSNQYALDTIAAYIVPVGEDGGFDYENAVNIVEPFEPSTVYGRIDIDLADYAGETVYIAIRHFNSFDMMKVYVDLFQVWGVYDEVDPTDPPLDPTPAPTDPPEFVGLIWDFETNPWEQGFDAVDADEDGNNWHWVASATSYDYHHEGQGCIKSESYLSGSALTPDNWLITPAFTNGTEIRFWLNPRSSGYNEEHIGVYVTVDGDAYYWGEELWSLTLPPSVEPVEYTVDLSAYAGQTIRVAFRHYNCTNQFAALLDYITVPNGQIPEPPAEPEEVDLIEITGFTAPEWGEHPDYTVEVPEDAGYTIEETAWYYYGKGAVAPEDVFDDPNVGYYQYFGIKLKEGYTWASSVGAMIDGQYSLVDFVLPENDPTLKSVYTVQFTVEEPVEPTDDPYLITEINVNGFVDPVPGMTAAEYMALFVDEGEHYTIDIIQAYDEGTRDELIGDEVLQDGHNYIVGARVFVDEGYYFTEDTTLLANGGTATLNTDFSGVADSETAWVVVGPTICGVSDLDRALNISGGTIHFVSDGLYPWFTVDDEESGRFYAQSGNGGNHDTSSSVWTQFDSVEGDVLVFDYKAWGEGSGWDTCEFHVDEHRIFSFGALDNDWTTYIYPLEPGSHLVSWVYNKDGTVHPQGDYFALDEVYVGPPTLPEEIEAEDITVLVNHTGQIEWTVLPDDSLFKDVKFEVADDSIATVDKNGVVHGLTVGDTEVTISIDYFPEEDPVDPYPYPTVSSTYDEGDPDYPEVSTTITVHVVPVQDLVIGYYFETQPEEEGWQFIDADGDGSNWHWNWDDEYYEPDALAIAAYEGEGFIMSESVLEPYTTESTYEYDKGVVEPEYVMLDPDNWAISPAVTLPNETAWMTFFASSFFYDGYVENYELYIGLTDDIDEMELLQGVTPVNAVSYYDYYHDEMLFNYEEFSVDLTAYAGQTVYVAFRHLLNLEDEDDYSNIFLAIDAVEFYGTDAELTLIDTIEINEFVVPEWDADPFYNVTVPADAGYELDYTDWNWWSYDLDDGDMMYPGDAFDDESLVYYQYFELTLKEGYAWADEVTVLINGEETFVENHGVSSMGYYWVYTIDFTVEEPVDLIDTIEINDFVVPAWGEAPFYEVTVPEGAGYEITYTDWNWFDLNFDDGVMADGDLFDNDEVFYWQYFEVTPLDGYAFAEAVTVLINGDEDLVDFAFLCDDGTYAVASIDFTVEEPVIPPTEPPAVLIDAVDVSELEIPAWGANPDFDVVLPDDAHYFLNEFIWDYYNGEEDVNMAPEDVFNDPDGEYYTIFVVDPEDGCEFAPEEELTVTINGTEDLVDFFFLWDGELYIVSIDFTVEEPPAELIPIHEVIVNGWGRPVPFVAGIDHVFLETPVDAPYFIVYGGWRDETDQQQMWSEDHVFMPDHWYSEGCQIWADEGYYFADDCVFRTEDDRVHLDYEYCYVDEIDDWICYMNIEPILCILWGDAEHDNDVDSPDVLLLMRYCMNLVPAEDVYLEVCDVNADGYYNMADALLIIRKVLNLIDYFPVELIY